MTNSAQRIANLDANDPLAKAAEAFDLPDGVIYLDGNSLGPPPHATLAQLEQTAAAEWGSGLIRSWNDAGDGDGWIDLAARAGAKIARIIGGEPDCAIVADSVSINLYKLAGALLECRGAKTLLAAQGEFPTDRYMLQGLAEIAGVAFGDCDPDMLPDTEDFILVRSLVDFRSGGVADMAAQEAEAKARGGAIIWDLSHAAGVLDVALAANGARYAVGCGYKFLNGGPGAPAFLYAAGADDLMPPLRGWMGHAAPFLFAPSYAPAPGVKRFACGTPPILSLAALDASLDVFSGVAMADVEAKARALGDLFIELTAPTGLRLASPPPGERRGGHVCLGHDNAYAVMQALIARGVIGDFRPPDLLRFGFSPLFLRYRDVAHAAGALLDILSTNEWRRPEFSARRTVV